MSQLWIVLTSKSCTVLPTYLWGSIMAALQTLSIVFLLNFISFFFSFLLVMLRPLHVTTKIIN